MKSNSEITGLINQGELVEEGNHDQLLSNCGLYENLWSIQQGADGWRVK